MSPNLAINKNDMKDADMITRRITTIILQDKDTCIIQLKVHLKVRTLEFY